MAKIKSEKEPINLGIGDNPKITYIASCISYKNKLIELIKEFRDCHAWEVQDMTGVDPAITVHKIPTFEHIRKLRRLKPELSLVVKDEIVKLLKNGFIKPITYPSWLANIVSILKKDEKVRVCVDYRDLNKACPKDNFLLPHIDLLIDKMAGCA